MKAFFVLATFFALQLSLVAYGKSSECAEKLKLEGMPSSQFVPTPPTSRDYQATFRKDSYQILKDLPQVPVPPATAKSFLISRSSDGRWQTNDENVQLSQMVQIRIEKLFQQSIAVLGPRARIHLAQIKFGDPPHKQTQVFHPDLIGDAIALDAWGGEKTYIQGANGNIFQPLANEAVLFAGGMNGTLHSAPPDSDGLSRRTFVFIAFSLD